MSDRDDVLASIHMSLLIIHVTRPTKHVFILNTCNNVGCYQFHICNENNDQQYDNVTNTARGAYIPSREYNQ